MRSFGPIELLATALAAGSAGAWLTLWVSGPSPSQSAPAPVQDAGKAPLHGGSFAAAVARSAPAIVSIYAGHPASIQASVSPSPDPRAPGPYPMPYAQGESGQTALGSGVILTADGLILTNRHVVRGAASIRVVLADGRALVAEVLGLDSDTDLALLQVAATGLPTAPLGDPQTLRVGDVTLAIGNPFGVGQTVTQGIVSAIGRAELGLTPIEHYIQTDAAINPGNSGGALINAQGELIGINTAIYSESGISGGIGFAIPVDLALAVAGAIADQGQVQRGWIGMSGRSVTPELAATFGLRAPRGVLVSSTLRDSPAEQAGLRPGDVVTQVGDRPVQTLQDLLAAIAGAGPNQPVSLEVWRGSERLKASTVTERRPDPVD